MALEVQEDNYRKKFPKGPDWEEPKPGPYNLEGQRIPTSAYHGMEVVAVSIEKYNDLMKDFSKLVTAMNTLLQNNSDDEYIKTVLKDIGIMPE